MPEHNQSPTDDRSGIMGRLNGDQKQSSGSRPFITLIGWLSLATLLLELGVLCLYFSGMSFLMLVSLQWNTTEKQVAMLAHMMVAVVSFVLMVGVVLCFSGSGLRKPLIKYAIILLSVLGMSVLPITIHAGLDDSFMLQLIRCLAGLSVALLINTICTFAYMERRISKRDKRLRGVGVEAKPTTSL